MDDPFANLHLFLPEGYRRCTVCKGGTLRPGQFDRCNECRAIEDKMPHQQYATRVASTLDALDPERDLPTAA